MLAHQQPNDMSKRPSVYPQPSLETAVAFYSWVKIKFELLCSLAAQLTSGASLAAACSGGSFRKLLPIGRHNRKCAHNLFKIKGWALNNGLVYRRIKSWSYKPQSIIFFSTQIQRDQNIY